MATTPTPSPANQYLQSIQNQLAGPQWIQLPGSGAWVNAALYPQYANSAIATYNPATDQNLLADLAQAQGETGQTSTSPQSTPATGVPAGYNPAVTTSNPQTISPLYGQPPSSAPTTQSPTNNAFQQLLSNGVATPGAAPNVPTSTAPTPLLNRPMQGTAIQASAQPSIMPDPRTAQAMTASPFVPQSVRANPFGMPTTQPMNQDPRGGMSNIPSVPPLTGPQQPGGNAGLMNNNFYGPPQSMYGGGGGYSPMQFASPMMGGGMNSPYTGGAGLPPAYGGNPGWLQSIYAGGGNPINQTPAWNAMVAAQQRNIQEGQAQLQAQFDVGDNRFSTAFGQAATDYQNQAQLQQNALLGQMTAQAGENAAQRMYGAGGQLSGQDFQSQMQQYGMGGQMAELMAGQSGQAANQLANLGFAGTQGMYGGAMSGAQGLFNTENAAGMGMFNAQNTLLPSFMQNDYLQQQLGMNAALGLNNAWNQNLGVGSQLGQQQYGIGQQQINNQYQNWLYQQPQNNPLLQMMYQASTYYPSGTFPSYVPGAMGSIMQGAGSLAGGILGTAGIFSDERMKENIVRVGTIANDLPVYTYNFIGDSTPRFGPMAQEVGSKWPDAVIEGNETHPWMIKLNAFINHLTSNTKER